MRQYIELGFGSYYMKGLTASPFSPPPIRSFVENFRFHIAETCVGHNQSKAIVRNDLFKGLDFEVLGSFV